MRKNLTETEQKMWHELRAFKKLGFHFRKQAPIGNYIVDFVCLKHKLIIELDGGHHTENNQRDHDIKRDSWLKHEGYKVLRFWNEEFYKNKHGILDTILNALPLEGGGGGTAKGRADGGGESYKVNSARGDKLMKLHIPILLFVGSINAYSYASADSNTTPQVIVSCGESKGYTYYHSNALIPEDESGWTEDKVTDGSFFIEKSGEDYDLLFRDKLGLRSAKDDGAIVVPTLSNDTSLNLVVIYPENGTTEVYNIQHIGSENVEASWTSTKAGTLFVKSGVFYTRCKN